MLAAPGRMATGLARDDRGAEPEAIGTAAAISRAASGLRRIIDEHGPDAVALYVSGQMTTEAQYLANKLAKGFIRTANIESNSRLCMASAGSGYKLSLGADGPPGSYDDIDHADVFLVIGSNMADCHPVLFLRLMDRVAAGATLIVVDPRRTATADKATLHLPIKAGTDIALLNGLLHLIAADGGLDEVFIAAHTEGWEAMPELLAEYPPDVVASITGIPVADLRRAAALIGAAGNFVSCWTMGLNQSTHGTWSTNALVQPAPGDRHGLPDRERPVVADGPAQRDGRARDGLHGTGAARAAVGARRGRPRVRRGCVGPGTGHDPRRGRQRHDRPVRPHGRG